MIPTQKFPQVENIPLLNTDGSFGSFSTKDLEGKYSVLFFYPLDMTFVCPTEIISFSDRIKDFEALNCNLFTGSTDSEFSHLGWTEMTRQDGGIGKINMPMIADRAHKLSTALGIMVPEAGITFRATFIVAPDLTIRHISMNDLPVGRSVDETLRLVKAFQYTDKHGEVCPANWDENKPAMKASAEGKKEYISKM